MADTDKIYTSVAAERKKMQLLKGELDALDSSKADKATTLNGYGIADAYTKTEVNGLVATPHQNYVTVSATSQTTAATDVLPASGQAADTIYRVSNWNGSANNGAGAFDVTVYSEYAWDDVSNPNKYVFLRINTQIGEVFDISVYNNNAKYADLAAALGTNGANVPADIRRGGMSVKFVQSSDNNYVQYRYMPDDATTVATFTNVNNWEGGESIAQGIAELGFVPSSPLTPSVISEGWKLAGDGLCAKDSSYKMLKYSVNAGDVLVINVSKDSNGVMQFQSAASVPASGTNGNLVGYPYTNAVNELVKVPAGATYLIVSQAVTNTTNVVNKRIGVDVDNYPTAGSENFVKSGGIVRNYDSVLSIFGETEFIAYRVQNGSQGNPSNAWVITLYGSTTTAIPVTPGQRIKLSALKKPIEGFNYYYRIVTYSTNSPSNLNSQKVRDLTMQSVSLDVPIKILDGEYGLSIQLREDDSPTASQGSEHSVALRTNTFKENELTILDVTNMDDPKALKEMVQNDEIRYDSLLGSTELLPYGKQNGSQGNPGNAWVITLKGFSTTAIPVTPGKNIKVSILKQPVEGFNYYYRIVTYSTSNPSSLNSQKVRDLTGNASIPINVPIKILDGEYGLSIQIREGDSPTDNQTSEHSVALRTNSFGDDEIAIISSDGDSGIIALERKLSEFEGDIDSPSVVHRNLDKLPMLSSSCRYRKSSNTSKDFQLLIVTDSHNDDVCVSNSVAAANGFDLIDALIHCGDVVDNVVLGQNYDSYWKNIVSKCKKPYYFVIGNHEAGGYYPISASPTQEQLYTNFIKPSVDAGHLVSGEYSVGKCYYYHDFTSLNIRLIVLNEYEAPRIPNTTAYWKPIAYNSSLPNYANNTAYTTGTQVNVSGYTDYSFEAVSSFNSGGFYDNKAPAVKYRIGYRWISQAQAQWFLDTLASTPSGYKVVVACHNPFSVHADVLQNVSFSQKNGWTDGHGIQNYMTNDFIADALNAYQTKSNFSTTCSSQEPDGMPSYNVSKDFSNVVGVFHSIIGGHEHQDCVWKHQTYNQYQVTPICANTNNYAQCPNADIRRPSSDVVNELDTDCLTVISFRPNQLGLVKIGVNVTETGEKRDYEVIDISGN